MYSAQSHHCDFSNGLVCGFEQSSLDSNSSEWVIATSELPDNSNFRARNSGKLYTQPLHSAINYVYVMSEQTGFCFYFLVSHIACFTSS